MLLRRITKHVKDQNWFAVGLDFFIVVFGVFMGFQVNNWANEQGRQQLERNYSERLHDEVIDLQETRAPLLGVRELWKAGLLSATPLLFNNKDRDLTPAECWGIAQSYIVSNPTDSLASLIELQESGQLFLLRNKQLSTALQTHLLIVSRARDSGTAIEKNVKKLSSEYPDLIKVVTPTLHTLSSQGALTRKRAVHQCDLEAMRANQAFLNDFDIVQSGFNGHMSNNIRVSNSLAKIHRVLDDILGVTHKETP